MSSPPITAASAGRTPALSLLELLARVPAYLRLVFGMLRDSRVSTFDRALSGLSIVYLFLPFDLLPDVIPVLGQLDDVVLMAMAMTRMFDRARRDVVLSHWSRAPGELDPPALRRLIYFASLFVTPGRRRRLRRLLGRAAGA